MSTKSTNAKQETAKTVQIKKYFKKNNFALIKLSVRWKSLKSSKPLTLT